MSGRILVVDDNALSRMLLSRAVREQGHEVETAPDGGAALVALHQEAFDLVLLDVLMPEVDGYQVLEVMMADPALQHIPVIMVSALEEMDSVIRCIELGAQDYLPKPADPLLLKARINASLAKKSLHDLEVRYLKQIEREKKRADDLLHVVIPIGAALSGERDFGRLLDRILGEAMAFCNAAAGVLYLRAEDGGMRVVTARSEEAEGATAATIPDVTGAESFLELPLRSGQGDLIGLVQLIDARDSQTGSVTPFDTHLEQMMTSLSTLAAVALENYQREQRLHREIEVLRIEIDEARDARAVAELTDTEFFRQLEAKVDLLRRRIE